MPIDVIISAVITVLVLSYMLGDNPFFRLALHVLVGVGATYVLAIAIEQVLWPSIGLRLLNAGGLGDQIFALFALLGCVFLFAKVFKRAAWLGNVAVGYMIGVGTAVALGGALVGTLAPQTLNTVAPLSQNNAWIPNILVLLSTLVTLAAFRYRRTAARSVSGLVGRLGRAFLYVAFGATFALVFVANASVLVSLVQSIVGLILGSAG